jgi:radical SAM protein with 4Fe4S-binding SPASM domain
MIEEIRSRGFFLNVINNGTLMTPERTERLLDIGVDRLTFSLDSLDPDIYPRIRRGAALEVTLRNILTFLKLNYERGLGIYANISTVNTKKALSSKINIFDYFSKMPVHVVYTSELLNFHDMLAIREETKFNSTSNDIRASEAPPICLNGFDRLLIRPNGNVSLCAIDWDSVHVLGNVHDTPYTELWNNPRAREFREALIEGNYARIEGNKVLCSRCDGKWVQSTSARRGSIAEMLARDLRDTKEELDRKISAKERHVFLVNELSRLEGDKIR